MISPQVNVSRVDILINSWQIQNYDMYAWWTATYAFQDSGHISRAALDDFVLPSEYIYTD